MKKLNNVIRKGFYDRVKEAAYENDNQIGWVAVPERPYIYVCRYEKEWITELITVENLQQMYSDTPWFIISQTGTGKTSFIFKRCLPVAYLENCKVLYLCSRIALKAQIKEIAMKDPFNRNIPVADYDTVGDMAEYVTEKGLEKRHGFGLIDVYSYHEFLHCSNADWSQYSIVVMDEAHFFVSDATFNVCTEEILKKIVRTFQGSRRIYLTATPEESIEAVYREECRYFEESQYLYDRIYGRNTAGMGVYLVEENYDYLSPFFFTEQSEIAAKIRNTPENVRWLIFIRSKEAGKALEKEIGIAKKDITYYDADTDRESEPHYRHLIQNEELETRVTISTKVFDVGINVKTENLNLVIFDDNPVEMKQMVGRKRLKAEEKVNVFFHVPGVGELNKRIGQIKQRIRQEEEAVEKAFKSRIIQPEHPFFITRTSSGKCKINVNHLSREKHMHDVSRIENLLDLMEDSEKEERIVYAEQVLSWFHLNYENVEHLFLSYTSNDEQRERLHEVMQRYMCYSFDKEKFDQLSKEVREVIGDTRMDTRSGRGEMGIKALNTALQPYQYRVIAKGNPREYRVEVIKGEESDV